MAPETPPDEPEKRLGVLLRNPLPLSASQEAQVRDLYYARVRQRCSDEIKGKPPDSPLAGLSELNRRQPLPPAPPAAPFPSRLPAGRSTAP